MREIRYHRHAVKYLQRMPDDRKSQFKAAISEIAAMDDPLSHQNVRAMAGEWAGCFRLRIGSYRAVFHCVDREGVSFLEVLQVGPRGDVYG